jgi:RimJ/RimL family protein N-acetyltransferase
MELRGKRVRLRPYRPDELQALVDLYRRSEHSVTQPGSDRVHRDRLRRRIARSGRWFRGRLDLAVEADGRLAGTLDARAPEWATPPGVCEIGIELIEHERGRGLGTEAVRLFTESLLANGFGRVEASTDLRNTPMRRVLEKVGFVYEGTMRSYMPDGEDRVDFALYAVTRNDVE